MKEACEREDMKENLKAAAEDAMIPPERTRTGGKSVNIYESAEDYLEQILMLLEQKGHARSIDIAAGLGFSKPSVSIAMKKLRENGYITMGTDNNISLTDQGYAIARRIYDRHKTLTRFFMQLGVDEETARADACKVEHDISEETYQAICGQLK